MQMVLALIYALYFILASNDERCKFLGNVALKNIIENC